MSWISVVPVSSILSFGTPIGSLTSTLDTVLSENTMRPVGDTAHDLDAAGSVVRLAVMVGVILMVRSVPALFVTRSDLLPLVEMRVAYRQ